MAAKCRLPEPVYNSSAGFIKSYTNTLYDKIDEARIKCTRLEHIWRHASETIILKDLTDLDKVYRSYKKNNYLYDFTDFLEKFLLLDDDLIPGFDTLYVDESQDLSRLQWQVVNKIAARAKKVYVAGDDDQSIYTWAGADLSTFLSLFGIAKEKIILNQSYRVPRAIHKVALDIIDKLKLRISKPYQPTPDEGQVTSYASWADFVSMCNKNRYKDKPDKWLILARNNSQLDHARLTLSDIGIDPKIHKQFKLSTIHSAKGSEEDNVVLITDIGRRAKLACLDHQQRQDDEMRLFYVAVTRAKKTLHIIKPETIYNYEIAA